MKIQNLNKNYIQNNRLTSEEVVQHLIQGKKSGKRLSQAIDLINTTFDTWIGTSGKERILKIVHLAHEAISHTQSIKKKYKKELKKSFRKITEKVNENRPSLLEGTPSQSIIHQQTAQRNSSQSYHPTSSQTLSQTHRIGIQTLSRSDGARDPEQYMTIRPTSGSIYNQQRTESVFEYTNLENAIDSNDIDKANRSIERVLHTFFGGEKDKNSLLIRRAIEMCNFDIAKQLLRLPLDNHILSTADESGNTPLHTICFSSYDTDLIIGLIEKGASLTIKNSQHLLPLEIYLDSGGKNVLKILKRIHNDIQDTSDRITQALSASTKEDRIQRLFRLIQSSEISHTLIEYLIRECNIQQLQAQSSSTPQNILSNERLTHSQRESLMNRLYSAPIQPGTTHEIPLNPRTSDVSQLEIIAQEQSIDLAGGTRLFLERIQDEANFTGTPPDGTEALRIFWRHIRVSICHIIDRIQQTEDQQEKRNLIIRVNDELADASSHCGGRYHQEALRLYRSICLGNNETFDYEVQLSIAELRANILETIVLEYARYERVFDAHILHYAVRHLGHELSIPGYNEITAFQDRFAITAPISIDHVRRKFYEQYTPYTIAHYIQQSLNDDSNFKATYLAWWKKNTPPDFQPNRIRDAIDALNTAHLSNEELREKLQACDIYCNAPLNSLKGRNEWRQAIEDDRKTEFVHQQVLENTDTIKIEKIIEMLEKIAVIRANQ